MHILIKSRFILLFAALTSLLFIGACTLEDGAPFGYASFELSVEEPGLGPDFALESFEVEVESLHIWAGAGAEQPADDHGHDHGHDHEDDHGDEEAPSVDAEDLEIGHLEVDKLITSTDAVALGEAGITNDAAVDHVEIEIHALSAHGVLTRGGEQIPATITLPHAHLAVSGPADLSFTADDPETQHLHVHLHWPENWLEDVDIDALEVDPGGNIIIGDGSNPTAAAALAEHLHGARLVTEVR
ncbi:hypothetical protein [Bradymonas sediminis]|uniref:Uncharacterized protein n=1 Tax=Bradymonas sediminis TaxID=1548548 RepID=A0A2Z4FP47_9DELT|nr:hypothetical protein [Bradymonas sediminis]AWV90650.1 hypothetical protein DN745_15490 [Bradymonas sediminis]TDP62347.1 hypothetical protein DFR33_11310 [Bradymonas sediminis]